MASLNSEKCAVIEREKRWNYSDFKCRVAFAMNYFLSNKYKRVMIVLPQGFNAYTLIWGAYLAKVTFCPVNEKNPPERKAYFAQAFKPDIIISDSPLKEVENMFKIVSSTNFFKGIDEFDMLNIQNNAVSSNLAYVIFTSGSTGLPKGVMISWEAIDNFVEYCVATWEVTEEDVFGQYSNIGFDLSIADIFVSIICGATLVPIASDSEKLMPGKMIKKHKITFWHSVPSVVDLLDRAKDLNENTLSSLRAISFCGEKLFQSHLDKLFLRKRDLIVFNTYGPTETTIFCTLQKITISNYKLFADKTMAIGNAIDGMVLDICDIDENGIGELYISGINVSLGYLNDISLTNTVFSEEVINGNVVRKYKTGDFIYKKDENIYFYGRKDSQIKKMGHRVDLSEVDYWLREYGCSAVSTVIIGTKIISFIESKEYQADSILNYLKTKLPEYYLPQRIVILDKLPFNLSGKIDNMKMKEEIVEL